MTLLQSIRQAFRQWVKRWIVADVEPDPVALRRAIWAASKTAYMDAKARGDTRDMHTARTAMTRANCDLLRAEVGR